MQQTAGLTYNLQVGHAQMVAVYCDDYSSSDSVIGDAKPMTIAYSGRGRQ